MGKKNLSLYSIETKEALPTVEIDGKQFPFRLGVEYAEILQLQDLGQEIKDIAEKPKELGPRTEQEEARLRDLLRSTIGRMIEIPDEVADKLTDLQRFRIASIFNDLVAERVANPTNEGNGSG